MRLKRILKYSGYTIFGIFVFLFFTYLNFPYNKLKDRIFTQIEKQSGLIIDADELKSTLTLGMVLSDVTLSHRTMNLSDIKIQEIKLSPSLFSLITFRPKVKFDVGLASGDLSGSFQSKSATMQALRINLDSFSLKNKFLQEKINLDLAGLLSSKIDVEGNLQKAQTLDGEISLNIKSLKIGQTNVLNMNIPEIKLSKIRLGGELKKEKFTIKKFQIGGPKEDLEAKGEGDIQLNTKNINNSQLNLKLQFKLSNKIKEEFSIFLPFIASALSKDGFYKLKITGRLGAPMANPDRS